MERESWLPVVGFESRYKVSSLGRVYSIHSSRVMKTRMDKGYPRVNLYVDKNNKKTVHVHSLVLTAFVGAKPTGLEACHNNGVATDNRVSNLRWDTHKRNIEDRERDRSSRGTVTCNRGHEKSGDNLVARNSCRACHNAHGRLKTHPEDTRTLQAVADSYYQKYRDTLER